MSGADDVDALRAQLAEARAKREAKQANAEREDERARLKQELADEPVIEKAIDEHGAIGDGIAVLHTRLGVVIVRRPRQAVWRAFSDKDVRGSTVHTLVQQCLVHPTKAELDTILNAYPAALEMLGGKVAELATVRERDSAGK